MWQYSDEYFLEVAAWLSDDPDNLDLVSMQLVQSDEFLKYVYEKELLTQESYLLLGGCNES
jgi:hypothetical protein